MSQNELSGTFVNASAKNVALDVCSRSFIEDNLSCYDKFTVLIFSKWKICFKWLVYQLASQLGFELIF